MSVVAMSFDVVVKSRFVNWINLSMAEEDD